MAALPPEERNPWLDYLVPPPVRELHGLPGHMPWNFEEEGVCRLRETAKEGGLRVEVWPDPEARDPAFVLELADIHPGHVEASWIVLNDIEAPRFDVDRTEAGGPIAPGAPERNLKEEIRALRAGLAPNQVRHGIKGFAPLIARVEGFALALGAELLFVVPLAYHNAVKYEDYGFLYISGEEDMHWIHEQFLPGGSLHRQMDGSRPFRMPEGCATIRGRSWAIHDGILGRRWLAPRMFRIVGELSRITTFPGAVW